MRLWHIDILEYLPKSQLLAQKRECDLIWKDIKEGKKTNHILINYIWNYDLGCFKNYYIKLKSEFQRRNFKFKDNSIDIGFYINCNYPEHDFEYFEICFYNLKEKYMRGQKDFDDRLFQDLSNYYFEINEI